MSQKNTPNIERFTVEEIEERLQAIIDATSGAENAPYVAYQGDAISTLEKVIEEYRYKISNIISAVDAIK